jgi:hypothetical protein
MLLAYFEPDFAWQSQLRYVFDANAGVGSSSDASAPSLLSVLQMTTCLSYGFEYLVRIKPIFTTGFEF